MKQLSLSSLLLLGLAATLSAQGDAHDLRTTAKKGASVWIAQESKSEQAIDMGGQQMDMGNTITYMVQVTVADVDDKGMLTVEAKIGRVFGTMTIPMMGDVEFDSIDQKADDAPAEEDESGMPNFDAIGQAMGSLAGAVFTAKVDPFGQVKSMDGVTKVLDAARKKGGRMGGQMLGAQLNESAMERLVESAFGILPEQPIAVGASWDRNEDQKSSRMNVSNKMKLTLAKHDAESFEITASGTVEKAASSAEPAKDGEDEQAAMQREMMAQMKIENGKITGTAKISRTDGFLVASNSTMSMDMAMPSPMGGGEMTINQKVTTNTKRTTAEAATKKAGAAKEAPKEAAKEGGK